MTTCRRFHRVGNNFTLCVNIGKKDYVLAEHPDDTNTIFYYGVKGIGKLGTMFSEDFILIKEGDFADVRHYHDKYRIFHSQEDFHLVGFNTLSKGEKWEGRLIKDDETEIDLGYIKQLTNCIFLVCFNGRPVVNGKIMKRYEYALLNGMKEYKVQLNGGVLGLFYRIYD